MIRHIRWQIVLVILGVILAGVLLSYQAVGLEEIFVPASGGTLVEAMAGRPLDLNPLFASNNPVDRDISALIFEGLSRYDETGQLVPNLATGWNVSLDGLVYTFWIRQDVRWQDGISFTADDVLYTVGILQDPGYTGPPDLAELWRTVEVTKVNRFTVTFSLQEPFAPFLDYTTIGILPIHVLQGVSASQLAATTLTSSLSAPADFSCWNRGTTNTWNWSPIRSTATNGRSWPASSFASTPVTRPRWQPTRPARSTASATSSGRTSPTPNRCRI